MQKVRQNFLQLSYILSILFVSSFYAVFNNSNRGIHSMATNLDSSIPFIKLFVLPYISWYVFPFIVLIYLCINDKDTYYKTLISYNIGLIICYIIFYFYQTVIFRPFVPGNDMLSRILNWLYTIDGPYNCFPSIHVYTCYLMIKAIDKSHVKTLLNSLIIKSTAILIIISTLFIKQHLVWDVVGSVVLCEVIFVLMYRADINIVFAYCKKLYSSLTVKRRLEA